MPLPDSRVPEQTIEGLQAEVVRLQKTVGALMDRAERSVSRQGSDFGLFQTTIVLEEQVKTRTADLENALYELELVNRMLHSAQETLLQSEERFQLFTAATKDVIWDIDLTTGESWVSSSHDQLYERSMGSGEQHSFEEWKATIHPEDLDRVLASFTQAIAEKQRTWSAEFRYRRIDGSYANILDRAFFIANDAGQPVRAVGAMTDITERIEMEEAQRAKGLAEKANQEKSLFLSRMSHELRTPLNAILGFAQIMEMYEAPDGQKDCLDQILKGGRHLLGLINEVLDISRIESGNVAMSREPVAVEEAVGEALAMVAPLAAGKGISIGQAKGAEGLFVMADRQRLIQILINLLTNGIKYNVENGSVEILWHVAETGEVRISVRDTGVGIDKDKAHRVFMPFDRLDAEKLLDCEGTGLGLALSKNLAEAMDGSISFESTPGEGSVFHLRMPQAGAPQIALEDLLVHKEGTLDSLTKNILYIEDNGSNILLMEHIVAARSNWHLETSTTSADGLRRLEEHRPDLVLLDLDLPDVPGLEVLDRVRANPDWANLPVIIVSADATPSRIDRLMAAGADGYVTKPFGVRDLMTKIDDILSAA